jgi:alkylation response protein AidB-like acyl-CoA dehydrogenase
LRSCAEEKPVNKNFYLDNADLVFQIEKLIDWDAIVRLKEDVGSEECPFATTEEAAATYCELLADPIGALAAERIAPRAADVDREGCQFDGTTVKFPEGLVRNLKDLCEAQVMGLTLPRKYGGLQFPETIYTAAIEIISRADASLMNFFGLQGGIAATINQFGSDALKDRYLPGMSSGEKTGAMALTEPDAGSDLAAIQTRAALDATLDPVTGEWLLTGTKRFITNGCGDVILTLARSENPATHSGARGLSFFVVEKSDRVTVRRIEHKLGINGSPTCEIYLDKAPALLIGRRGHGLARYTAWLMMAARVAVAGQAVGICEAAVQEARRYADEREQFGKKISALPQVAAMLEDMQVYTEAGRALLYATSEIVDLHQGAEQRELASETRKFARLAGVLTPMTKYYCAELANRVAYIGLQVHGGAGYMKEYAAERLSRDARITNIYEGTSQIQIAWAAPRLLKGDLDDLFARDASHVYTDASLAPIAARVSESLGLLREAMDFVRAQPAGYEERVGIYLVDMAIDVLVSQLFLRQAERSEHKKRVLTRFVRDAGPRVRMNLEYVRTAEAAQPVG